MDAATVPLTPQPGSDSATPPVNRDAAAPPAAAMPDAAGLPTSDAGALVPGEGGVASAEGGTGSGALPPPLTPITDYTKSGPFKTKMVTMTGPGNAYTVFRPEPLGENGFKHSPLIFGCGIATTPSWYVAFLTTIASHGFVVIASDSSSVTEQMLKDGLAWILEQNDKAGDYQGKLDVKRAVSMGYSIGGTAAVKTGANPAVVTTISIHGHTTASMLHGPLLQTTGTNDTSGVPLQQATYDMAKGQTFMATLQNASHFEILGGENLQSILDAASGDGDGGRELAPIVAWLRYWVHNDQGAKHFFYGDDCVLCKAPWTNPQRKNWQ